MSSKKYSREYYETHKIRLAKSNKEYYEKNKEAINQRGRIYARKRKYSLDETQFKTLFTSQGGACSICGVSLELEGRFTHVDHCHTTGKVRGILCKPCNTGLGDFKDDVARLTAAIVYLNYHETSQNEELLSACK